MPDIDSARSERLCSGNLCSLVVRAEIEVKPILDLLALRDPTKKDVGRNTILRRTFRWFKDNLVGLFERDAPAEQISPPSGQRNWIYTVDNDALPFEAHHNTLAPGFARGSLPHIGDIFGTDEGCGSNRTAMQDAFDEFGLPETACVAFGVFGVDHEYCAPLS